MTNPERAAIVTGGAQGIGRCTALTLLEDGYRVVIADPDVEAGEELAAEHPGERFVFVPTDVSREDQVEAAVKTALERFGRLDALVNNAGIGAGGPVDELSPAAWNRVIGVNLTGAFLMAHFAVPHLKQSHGAIVNIASTRALMSEANTEAYSASKGGIVALTHALAVSLSGQVRVNCISPGWIDVTPWQKRSKRRTVVHSAEDHAQHPAGRVGKPEDIASMVRYLLSDDAGFITGQNIVIDGGMTIKMIYV